VDSLKNRGGKNPQRLFVLLKIFGLILITALTLSSILFQVPRPVNAIPGGAVDSTTNLWAPYGPRAGNLQYVYYASETSEFVDFENGQLDLTDWPVSKAKFSGYDSNPDFLLTPGQGQYGMYGIDFNYASSTWPAWGCDFQHGNSPCGIEIREAMAHLVDRQAFVNDGPLGGAGQGLADPSPAAKDPSASPLPTQVSWDTLIGQNISGIVHPPDVSAFHIAASPGGFAAVGSPDFCAARDHLIAANIGLRDVNHDCVIDATSPGIANIVAHPIRFMIRSDDVFRQALGIGLSNALNQIFGGFVVSTTIANIAQLGPIVFVSAPEGATDDWDMYTFGWSLPGPFPDHLLQLYYSSAASNQCGGVQNGSALNYGFACISSFDSYVNAASQTADIGTFKTKTLAAFNEWGKHVGNIPSFSRGIRIAALRTLAGAVNQRGASYPNGWTLLNGHNDTSYTPSNPLYRFGGGSNTIRWGQRQGTTVLNPFKAQTLWEFNVIGEVYDTVFAPSPIQPANILCWMCNNYKQSVDVQGNTHFLVQLKTNLRWQDGVTLNASDIKFSLLNYRDVPAAVLSGNVAQLLGVTIYSSSLVDIKMQGQSISHIVNLAGIPIIPKHIWELPGDKMYGDVGKADPAKTSLSYDVINAGAFIGSGPYVCKSLFPPDAGRIGTGCTRNSDGSRGGQALGPQGGILLYPYDRTSEVGNVDPFLQCFRNYNAAWGTGTGTAVQSGQYQEFRWADKYGNATVTLSDVASVAFCYGKTSASGCADYTYWLRPALHPGTPTTIGAEVNVVVSHFEDTWVWPFSWSGDPASQPGLTLENIQPFAP